MGPDPVFFLYLEELAVMLLGHDELVDVLLPLGLVRLEGGRHPNRHRGGPRLRLLFLEERKEKLTVCQL